MSLDWSLKDVKDHELNCFKEEEGKRYLKSVTHALLFATMPIGLGEISEKNITEFHWRNLFCEHTGLTFLDYDGDKRVFTLEQLRMHIGLRTNVSKLTRKQFIKQRIENVERDVNWFTLKDFEKENSNG
jgi:hypothetical protein